MTSGNRFSFAKHLVAPYEGREQTPVALDALVGLREAASPRLAAKLWQSETRDSGSGSPIWETGVTDVGAEAGGGDQGPRALRVPPLAGFRRGSR